MRTASTRSLRPVQRAGLYYRVSSEEQVEGYSLDAQQRAALAHCTAHGWAVAGEYRDEGKSARTDDIVKRPAFRQMIDDAEAGLLDVIVVHKLDRFARNLRVTLETLERLDKVGVGFVSLSENMDFTTPIGKVILATMAAFAQYYSDNLSWEVKKGKHERKAQGLYNGLLPFGLKKNSQGIPVPDPATYPGLLLAFRLAAEGQSDREVAEALTAAGYRSTGNRGRNPFTRDSVCVLLQNRFYLGELPDGQGGWLPGAHEAVLDDALFEAAQRAREANRTSPAVKVRRAAAVYSLSGLAVCGHCGGRLHFYTDKQGRGRVFCYQRQQTAKCAFRSAYLAGLEEQLVDYLATFHLPDEAVAQLVALVEGARSGQDDDERRRREIASRLERIKELYGWGDLSRAAYQAERERLQAELATLRGLTDQATTIAGLAAFLRDLPAAWRAADGAERNRMARLLFQGVEVQDDRVEAVVPQPDFVPFFALACQGSVGSCGSDGGRIRHLCLDRAACCVAAWAAVGTRVWSEGSLAEYILSVQIAALRASLGCSCAWA